eukprot:COSAG03_NODE_11991_length_567_cov_0.666667_1_plen_41_part_10
MSNLGPFIDTWEGGSLSRDASWVHSGTAADVNVQIAVNHHF